MADVVSLLADPPPERALLELSVRWPGVPDPLEFAADRLRLFC